MKFLLIFLVFFSWLSLDAIGQSDKFTCNLEILYIDIPTDKSDEIYPVASPVGSVLVLARLVSHDGCGNKIVIKFKWKHVDGIKVGGKYHVLLLRYPAPEYDWESLGRFKSTECFYYVLQESDRWQYSMLGFMD